MIQIQQKELKHPNRWSVYNIKEAKKNKKTEDMNVYSVCIPGNQEIHNASMPKWVGYPIDIANKVKFTLLLVI